MTALNPNQQRRIGTHLRLLSEDVETIGGLPTIAERPEITGILAALHDEISGMRREFALPPDWQPSLARKVAALAEVWLARVEDLRGQRLSGYGEVPPPVRARLDPHVDRLRDLLRRLADAAHELPHDPL